MRYKIKKYSSPTSVTDYDWKVISESDLCHLLLAHGHKNIYDFLSDCHELKYQWFDIYRYRGNNFLEALVCMGVDNEEN